jgi:acetyltransferase-like isoleucine patch superfamily enzyme
MLRQIFKIIKDTLISNIHISGDRSRIKFDKGVVVKGDVYFDVSKGGTIKIGEGTILFQGTIFATYGGDIVIGKNCSFNPYCVVYGHGGLRIGNYVRIATHTVIIPANHVFENRDTPIYNQGITAMGVEIFDNVWIGAGVKILDGVTIESGAVIAAGSVVNKNVKGNSIFGGVPAKFIKAR